MILLQIFRESLNFSEFPFFLVSYKKKKNQLAILQVKGAKSQPFGSVD